MSRIRLIILAAVAISLLTGLPQMSRLHTVPGAGRASSVLALTAAPDETGEGHFAGIINQSGMSPDLLATWRLRGFEEVPAIKPLSGLLPGEKTGGIDFDSRTLKIIGITNLGNIFIIDPKTGEAIKITSVSSSFTQGKLGISFDPETRKLLVFSDNTLFAEIDLSRNPPLVNLDTLPPYATDDANAGKRPKINGVTSTKIPGSTDSRTFVIDTEQDVLAELQKNFRLKTIKSLGVNASAIVGFSAVPGTRFAFAALQLEGEEKSRLFFVNLFSGVFFDLGIIGGSAPIAGLAVFLSSRPEEINCKVDPEFHRNPVGTSHTIRVSVTRNQGQPSDLSTLVSIEEGPNTERFKYHNPVGSEFGFEYTSNGIPGIDTILVVVIDGIGEIAICEAKKEWFIPDQPQLTISEVSKSGKHLVVKGCCFKEGDKIFINDVQQKTKMDPDNPETILTAKKGFKKLESCTADFKNRVFVRREDPGKPIQDTQAFATCP